ncbi:MAG: TonB family protein [Arenicella sp.]|jgi:TonB family protein|nr:TonB family protein [Arenicella sp.]
MQSTLENESKSSAQIEEALSKGNLFPPAKGNAYSLLLEAIGNKTISRSTHESLLERLETIFVKSAQAKSKLTELNAAQSDEIRELLKNGTLLGVKSPVLGALKNSLASFDKTMDSKEDTNKAEVVAKPTIAPAKLLSRVAAKYPSRALDRGIEGWVEVSFRIDTEGHPVQLKVTNSKPAKVFDSAALNAIQGWKFLPAMDMQTGSAVETLDKSTRMHFKIEG